MNDPQWMKELLADPSTSLEVIGDETERFRREFRLSAESVSDPRAAVASSMLTLLARELLASRREVANLREQLKEVER